MAIHVNIAEAKAHFSKLVDQAMRGEDVIVQRAGVPMLRLVPLPEAAKADRVAQWRKFDSLLAKMDAVPDCKDWIDPLEWDENGLPV